MGTLKKAKMQMKLDKDLRKMLVRGSRNEILLDIDGDKVPDIALIDDNRDGDIDTFAADLTGEGEFNLYIQDTDHNGIPDTILLDEDGSGEMKVIDSGEEVEAAMLAAASRVQTLLALEDYAQAKLDEALGELDRQVRKARKEIQKL